MKATANRSGRSIRSGWRNQWPLQTLVLPWIAWLALFCYVPMYGVVLAFKDFNYSAGILGSPWAGWTHFRMFVESPDFLTILRNTLSISFLKLLIGFPVPIVFALLLNELAGGRFKKFVQSVSYLPHFLSWVLVSGIVIRLLSVEGGAVNTLLASLGIAKEPIIFLGEPNYFWSVLVLSDIWKEFGWSSILYLAAIAGISQDQYEAAMVDGAGRLQRMIHVTLPSIAPTIVIVFIFSLSGIMHSNFEQVYLLKNPMVAGVGEVIDTYIFTTGISQARYSYATAVSLFQAAIGFILIITTNWLSKRISGHGIW